MYRGNKLGWILKNFLTLWKISQKDFAATLTTLFLIKLSDKNTHRYKKRWTFKLYFWLKHPSLNNMHDHLFRKTIFTHKQPNNDLQCPKN